MDHNSLPGWFDFRDLYQRQVDRVSPHRVPLAPALFIEIGCAFGKSAVFMGERILASKKIIRLTTIDPFLDSLLDKEILDHLRFDQANGKRLTLEESARANVLNCGVGSVVSVVKGFGGDVAVDFGNDSVDFVFLDGDHKYESVYQDILDWWPKLKSGCQMAGHDLGTPGVSRAVEDLHSGRVVTVDGGCWIVTKE